MIRTRSLTRWSLALLMGLCALLASTPLTHASTNVASTAAPLAGLEARVDRSRVGLGETLQLLLRYRGARPSTPDLSLLERDFEILDAGQSSRTSIVNGVADRSHDWRITLTPLREGTLTIPSFTVGGQSSAPVVVEVAASTAGGAGASGMRAGAPVRVDVEVDDTEPYVQGKVTVTARITLDESVREGSLADPALQGALIERLGEDTSFRTELDGKPYTVVERRYALFPQASGEVVIPPLVFEGTQRATSAGRRDPFADFFGSDPFGGDPFADFFGNDPFGSSMMGSSMMGSLFDRGRRIRAQSQPILLDVRPRPGGSEGAWFLPARHVELFEEWSVEPPVFRVGEQVVRTLGIQAVGLSGDQLPDIALPELRGAKQYPEAGADRTFAADGETVAVRVRDVAVLPTRAGELTLPALELEWWDTEADTRRTATLPERTVTVLPAPGAAAPAVARQEADTPDGPAPATPEPPAGHGVPSRGIGWPGWAPLVGLSALCALAVGIGLVRRRRRRTPAAGEREAVGQLDAPAEPEVGTTERALRDACRGTDPAAAARALVAAARARHPALGIRNLADVAEALPHEDLTRAVAELRSAAYAPHGETWDGAALWRAWTRRRRRTAAADRGPVEALPGLYPGG